MHASQLVCALLVATLACQIRAEDAIEPPSANVADTQSNRPSAHQPLESATAASPKTKRGIFHHGYHAHGLTYNVPLGTAAYPHYGFQKPWHQVSYAKLPAPHYHHHPVTAPGFLAAATPTAIVHHHHVPAAPAVHHLVTPTVLSVPPPPPPAVAVQPAGPHYVVSPGGASVTSYNVNYPRYPYYGKPHVDVPYVPVRPQTQPGVFFAAAKPVHAVGFAPAYANRIPLARPAFAAFPAAAPSAHHHHHLLPTASTFYAPAPAGVYPVAAAAPAPHFVPVPAATVPTFHSPAAVTPAIGAIPLQPTATSAGGFDQWRPIYVAQPAAGFPTISPTAAGQPQAAGGGQPSVSLLPPFGSAPGGISASGASTIDEQALFQQQLHELHQQQQQQQQYENAVAATAEYTAEQLQQQQQQQIQSQAYGPPSDNSLDAGQEYVQASQFQQQQRAIIEEQQQIHANGAFNGQAYEQASNNGHYAGPSSYEVQLNSYTRAV